MKARRQENYKSCQIWIGREPRVTEIMGNVPNSKVTDDGDWKSDPWFHNPWTQDLIWFSRVNEVIWDMLLIVIILIIKNKLFSKLVIFTVKETDQFRSFKVSYFYTNKVTDRLMNK